jgi:hypothetical protein
MDKERDITNVAILVGILWVITRIELHELVQRKICSLEMMSTVFIHGKCASESMFDLVEGGLVSGEGSEGHEDRISESGAEISGEGCTEEKF